MIEQQWFQKFELSNSVIGAPGGLLAFFSEDSDTAVGSEDHGDIVGTITDGEGRLQRMLITDESDNIRLLLRGYTASKDNVDIIRNVKENLLEIFDCFDQEQGASGNNYSLLLPTFILTNYFPALIQFLFNHEFVMTLDNMLVHYFCDVEEAGGESNIDSCFDLITGKYPYLNSGALGKLNGIIYLILQFILNSTGSNKLQVLFDFFIDFGDSLLSVRTYKFGGCLFFHPVIQIFLI